MDEHEETRPRRVSNGTQDLAPVGAVVDGVVLVARSTLCRRFDNVAPPMSCGVLLQMVRNSRASGCVVFGEWSVCCTRGCRERTVAGSIACTTFGDVDVDKDATAHWLRHGREAAPLWT